MPTKIQSFLSINKWPILIGLIAFVVRAIYLMECSKQPGFAVPMVDEKWHWLWANDILNNSFWGEGAYFRAPLYPYLLALLAKISAGSIFWSKLLQGVFCFGTAFFIYRLAKHLFDHKAAVTAGLVYAFYGTLIFYETMFLIPVLFLFLTIWGIYRLVTYRNSNKAVSHLLTGAVFGLAAISQPNVLLTIPFLLLWLYFSLKSDNSLKTALRRPSLVLAGTILAILPVTVRNLAVTGEFMLISSQGGVNFYLGNNPVADGLTMLMPEVMLDESISWDQFGQVTKAAAEKEAGRPLTDAQESDFWNRKAVSFIVGNPGKFVGLLWKKSIYLLSGFENSDNTDIYYQRTKSVLYSLLLWEKLIYFPFGLLLPLTFVGMYVNRHRFRELLPIYIFMLAYIPSIILFLVTARHRLPLVPFMIIISAGGIVALTSRSRWQFKKEIILAAGLGVLTLIIFNRTYFDEGKSNAFQIHFNNGIKFEQLGNYAEAEKEYRQADAAYPFSATLVNNLGYAQFVLERFEEAESNFHRALSLKHDFSAPFNNLGLLMGKREEYDSALALFRTAVQKYQPEISRKNELSQIYLNMSDVWESKEELDSASEYYQMAISAGPTNSKAYTKAAAFYARHDAHEIADTLFAEGRRYQDLGPIEYFNWGLSLMERKMFSAGLSMLFSALKRDEKMYQAHYLIAVGYYENDYPVDSVNKYLDNCLKYNPQYVPALELRKLVIDK